MNKKAVQWLYQELPELVKNGVLTSEAANNLRGHYGDVKAGDKKWFIIILCSVLGAILIGLGIISLFAHNWEDLSRPTRTVLSLLPLLLAQALAYWVIKNHTKSIAWREGTATFLSLMVGASIALIAQTYNIPGDTPTFLMTWMVLIIPLAYLMGASIPAAIYMAGISTWSCQFWYEPLKAFLFWPLLAVVIPHFIWSLRQERHSVRSALLALIMAVTIFIAAGFTLGRTWPGSWIVIQSSLMALFYLLGVCEFRGISTSWQKPFRALGGIGIFVFMFSLTFRDIWRSVSGHYSYSYGMGDISSSAAVPDHILTFLLVAGSLVLLYQFAKRQDWMNTIFGGLPLLALFGYVIAGSSPEFAAFLFNIYLLGASIYRIKEGIKINDLNEVNTGMFMLAVLVIARFFDSDINFILKGLVFIVIGMGFLGTNIMLLRRKGGAA